jgi:SAM-dependent MidA family methyltransferase
MNSSAERSTLPPLTDSQREHSRKVEALVRGEIAQAGGWISFDRFMELVLYSPTLGYYSAGSVKLGASGDYVTAPEISDLFSFCVAQQAAEVLRAVGGSILELGAGTGRMAAAMLSALATVDALPERYDILEVSADLRERQQQTISRLPQTLRDRVHWLDRLPSQPMCGAIVANEVLDALPFERFTVRGPDVLEIGVAVASDGSLIEQGAPAGERLEREVRRIGRTLAEPFPEGFRSELCERVTPWIAALAQSLERGALLLFDYGLPRSHLYHSQRHQGTLRCHFKQRAHADFTINPGVQDITAWVDFTRVAEAADTAGLNVAGFASQAAFLLGAGIEQRVAGVGNAAERARLASEARQLMLPGEMGEIFKAMALTRGLDLSLSAFAVQDLRHLL